MWPWALLTVVATVALLAAERSGSRRGVWIAKPLAAAGFLGAALALDATATPYGTWILVGLLLSACGDVLLIPRGAPRTFLAGLVAFLVGHVAYTIAFAVRGLDLVTVAVGLPAVLALDVLVLRWLLPHVSGPMRRPVLAYVLVISVMLVCAAGTVGAAGRAAIFVGAAAFFVSDLAVARERFVDPAFANKLWGLPLYFGAQLVLASTVAA